MINRPSANPADKLACEDGILPPCRRAALLCNKTATLDALASAGIARIQVEFEEQPFGCLIDSFDAFGHAGRFGLPDLQIRYAEPGRRRRCRHRKLHLISALSKMLDDLLSDDRDSLTAAAGILQIDVARRTFLLAGQSNGFQQQSFRRLY